MKTLTMDEARHFMGMPVMDCDCDGCARVIREREEQHTAGISALQKLADAGIKIDTEKVRKFAADCGVQSERN